MTDLDLTPREHDPAPRQRKGIVPVAIVVLMVVAIGFVLFKTLSDASLFFLNVDEAVEQREEYAESRFRMQGAPVAGSIHETSVRGESAVAFTVEFGCIRADVVHLGDPAELFQPTVPVVLEGSWEDSGTVIVDGYTGVDDGFYFVSDRMLVKHDNEYRTEFDARIEEAKAADDCAS